MPSQLKIIRFMAGNRNIRDPSVNHHFENIKIQRENVSFFPEFNGERSSCGGSTSPTHINTCNQNGYRPTRNRHFDLINTPIEEIHTAVKSACGYTHTHVHTSNRAAYFIRCCHAASLNAWNSTNQMSSCVATGGCPIRGAQVGPNPLNFPRFLPAIKAN